MLRSVNILSLGSSFDFIIFLMAIFLETLNICDIADVPILIIPSNCMNFPCSMLVPVSC